MTHQARVAMFIALTCLATLAGVNPDKDGRFEADGKKLDEQLKKISLLASDMDGRRVVNRVMAKELGVTRKQLVDERQSTQLVYGQIFAVHEIARQTNSSFAEIAKETMGGKSPLAISMEKGVDLKKILKDTKKLNSKLDSELAAVADGDESEVAADRADGYDPGGDDQPADTANLSPAERSQARLYVKQPPGLAARALASGRGGNAGAGSGRGGGRSAGGRGGGPH